MQHNRLSAYYRGMWEHYHGVKIPLNWQIHHKDGDKLNNCINNLVAAPIKAHAKFHYLLGEPSIANFILRQGFYDTRGTKNPMYGKKHTAVAKAKISLANTGNAMSLANKKKMSERLKGNTNAKNLKGYKQTTKHKALKANAIKGSNNGTAKFSNEEVAFLRYTIWPIISQSINKKGSGGFNKKGKVVVTANQLYKSLAKEFQVSYATIQQIIEEATYAKI